MFLGCGDQCKLVSASLSHSKAATETLMRTKLRVAARQRLQVSSSTRVSRSLITMRACLPAVLALLLAACAAIGPTSSPEFPLLVSRAVPPGDGVVHSLGSGNWYPNVRGFTATRSSLLSRPADPIPGALAITPTAIVFAQWDEASRKFDAVKRLPISDLMEVTLDSLGAGRRIVVRGKDLSYQCFEFTRASGNLGDGTKTEEAVLFLQAHLGGQRK